MTQLKNDHYLRLKGPVLLHVCKDGTITYRTVKEPIFNGVALPFYSVESKEDAQALQIHLCRLQYASHPQMNHGEAWYKDSHWNGNVDDIPALAARYDRAYWGILDRKQAPRAEAIERIRDAVLPRQPLGVCRACRRPVMGFRDEISAREHGLSQLCQHCQDGVFTDIEAMAEYFGFNIDSQGTPYTEEDLLKWAQDPNTGAEGQRWVASQLYIIAYRRRRT